MRASFRYLLLLVVGLCVLSLNLVQCRSAFAPTKAREQRSLKNIDYINMCMFRKTRLCDYLREMGNRKTEKPRKGRELSQRGLRLFYSNW